MLTKALFKMNLTNNVSRVTRSIDELERVIAELHALKSTAISTKNLPYKFHAAIDNFEDYDFLQTTFPIHSSAQVRFKMDESKPLHALILGKNVEKICLFNQKNGDSNRFLHYQMEIQKDQERCTLRIGLSCQKLRQKSKDDFIELVTHLVRQKLLFMTRLEIEDFANCIMEINSDAFSGISAFKDQFEVLTVPDFKPVGGIHFVPSIITLDFSREHAQSFGGFEKMAVAFLDALDTFFSDQEYVVKGTIICGNSSKISSEIKSIPYQTVRIPVSINLTDEHLMMLAKSWSKIKGKRKRIEIRNFAWNDSKPSYTENRISISPTASENEIEIVTECDIRTPKQLINSIKKEFFTSKLATI